MSTLDDIFRRDPLGMTREDMRPLVAYYREKRHQFKTSGLSPGQKEVKLTAKEKDSAGKINLKDAIEL